MRGSRTAAVAATGAVLVGLLLSGCTASGGDDSLPQPTGRSALDGSGTRSDATRSPAPTSTAGAQPVAAKPATVAAGTVVAEADAVSRSGDTAIHVRVVARGDGFFDAQLSGYRTTVPQPMTIEFRRSAAYADEDDLGAIGSTTWTPATGLPDTVSLAAAGSDPSWLRDVVLTPAPSGGDDSARPWVGSVLALGALSWTIPDPYPDLHVTVGKDRPGAYGIVFDHDGVPGSYRVAHGDEQVTVAERFGITVDELRWLNPTMQVRSGGWIYENTDLNLDPTTR